MKNILIITPSLRIGGSERVVESQAKLFKRNNFEVTILSKDDIVEVDINTDEIELHKNVHPKWARGKFIQDLFIASFIKKLELKKRFDLIISHYVTVRNWLPEDIERRTYYYVHFDFKAILKIESEISKNSTKGIRKKFFRKMRGYYHQRNVISVSQNPLDSLIKEFKVSPKKSVVIHNFYNIDEVLFKANQINKINIELEYIVHVGRFDLKQKRQDILLDAFKIVNSRMKWTKLVIVTEMAEVLLDMISARNLTKDVIVTGIQKNPYPIIKDAKLLVLCSDTESFGNVIVEALICGTPVVSTNCQYYKNEILVDELAHWLVPTGDAIALADKIYEALNTEIVIRKEIIERFSDSVALEKFLSLMTDK